MLNQEYKLVRLIGVGGMGSVYEALRTSTGERVAVKVLHGCATMLGRNAAHRFRREAKAAGAIDSPHTVQILDAGADDAAGTPYLVMEHITGEDLQRLIKRVGPLRPDAALRLAGQALLGLERAHAAGIIHRDIKPANLLLAPGEGGEVTVKIVDFGIAKLIAGAVASTTELTGSSDMLGSPLYMSPEQAQNSKAVDPRTDLWSLGGVLYSALAGRAPHQHVPKLRWMIIAICSSPAPPLRSCAPWVPPEVEEVVHRALEIDPEKRYPSAAAMLDAIWRLVPGGFALRDEMLAGVGLEAAPSITDASTEAQCSLR